MSRVLKFEIVQIKLLIVNLVVSCIYMKNHTKHIIVIVVILILMFSIVIFCRWKDQKRKFNIKNF